MAIAKATIGVSAVAALALAAVAGATPPTPVTIQTDGHFTTIVRDGQTVSGTLEGVWSATGTVTDSGTYTEVWRIVGDTAHCREILAGSRGSIFMERRAVIEWVVPGVSGFFGGGSWQIVGGTGAYERLRGGGGGPQSHTPDSFGDFATNVVHEVQLGSAHFD